MVLQKLVYMFQSVYWIPFEVLQKSNNKSLDTKTSHSFDWIPAEISDLHAAVNALNMVS